MRAAILWTFVIVVSIAANSATARPLPPSVLYFEDFEDGTSDGLTVRGGSYSVGAGIGSARGFVSSDFHNVITLDGVPSDNVAVDVDFQINSGSEGDFDTWLNATWNPADGVYPAPGYVAMVNPATSDNPLALLFRSGPIPGTSDETPLDQAPNTIGAAEPHHLRVEPFGPEINVLLDANPIMSATDSTYAGGEIGFRLFLGGIVDNIVVSVPEPTMAGTCAAVVAAVAFRRRHKVSRRADQSPADAVSTWSFGTRRST